MTDFNKSSEVLAIIPARGGSKGIPRKNIVDLCGKPLIAYTIEAALRSDSISRTVVSTDDEEIAEVARFHGAEVPFLRPKKLSEDRSYLGDAFIYTINRLEEEGYKPDALVQLYPTHPFRNPRFVNLLVTKLFEGYWIVKTVKPFAVHPNQYFFLDDENNFMPLELDGVENESSPFELFRPYGLLTATNRTKFKPQGHYYYKIEDPICGIDIDTPSDLSMAKHVIENNQFDFDLA